MQLQVPAAVRMADLQRTPAGSRSVSRMVDPGVFAHCRSSTASATRLRRSAWASSAWRCSARVADIKYLLRKASAVRGAVLMKILWSWLLEMCDLDTKPTVEEGASALTRGGSRSRADGSRRGVTAVVVAEVVGKAAAFQATSSRRSIVITERAARRPRSLCGAPNVPAPGSKGWWARSAPVPGVRITIATKQGRE